jgi:flagellar hook-associated protein 3 FlgL
MTAERIKYHLQRQVEQLAITQNRIATAKRFSKPSEDPSATGQILNYRSMLSSVDQYTRNIDQAAIRAEMVETTLSAVQDLMTRAKTIAAETNREPSDSSVLAEEVKNIRQQILSLANTRFNNAYLFAGHRSDTAPFAVDGSYQGDTGEYRIITGENRTIALKADGAEIFTGAEDIFEVLNTLQAALETGDTAAISAQSERISQAIEQLRKIRTDSATRHSLMDTAQKHWEEFRSKIETFIENAERVDLAAAVVELQSQQTAYEASLAVAAQLNRASLLDYLR